MHAGPLRNDQNLAVRVLSCLILESATKKERRTTAAPRTPTKGRIEQHLAGAPVTGRSPKHCFDARALRLRLVVFEEAET